MIKQIQSIRAFLFCFILSQFSCSQNSDSTHFGKKLPYSQKQISRIHYLSDQDAEKWFEYGENGDLISQGMSIDTIVFEYSENKIVKRHLDKNLSWISRIDYTTDQNGRIKSSLSFDEKDKVISKNEFFYNEDGYLIKNTEMVIASGSIYNNEYIYEEDNLKEVKAYDMHGKHSSSYVFEYYPDKLNILNLFMQQISDDIFPNGRLGKSNKNMVSQMSNISKEGDTLSLLTYKYPEIENESILKEIQRDVLNEFEMEVFYHFAKSEKKITFRL